MITTANASLNFDSAVPNGTFGSIPTKKSYKYSWSNGTTPPGAANVQVAKSYSVTSGTPLVLDLSGTSLIATDTATAVFAHVNYYLVVNTTTSGTATLAVGGGTTPFLANALPPLGPGDGHEYASNSTGLPVTASTNDLLQFVSSSGVITFDLIILGRTT